MNIHEATPPACCECPSCGRPLGTRALLGPAGARDENVRCPSCGWERDAGDDPDVLPLSTDWD